MGDLVIWTFRQTAKRPSLRNVLGDFDTSADGNPSPG